MPKAAIDRKPVAIYRKSAEHGETITDMRRPTPIEYPMDDADNAARSAVAANIWKMMRKR